MSQTQGNKAYVPRAMHVGFGVIVTMQPAELTKDMRERFWAEVPDCIVNVAAHGFPGKDVHEWTEAHLDGGDPTSHTRESLIKAGCDPADLDAMATALRETDGKGRL